MCVSYLLLLDLQFSFSPSNERDSLTTNSADVPLDDTNLVLRALNLFREKTGSEQYFWIDLQKQVPTGTIPPLSRYMYLKHQIDRYGNSVNERERLVLTGAGLGGGSGNGATALWAANEMTGRPATEEELMKWSVEVGSDCPFFFSTGAAYCTSKGENVQNVPPPLSLDTEMVSSA